MVCATCQTSFQSQAARSGSLHDRVGACRLAVHAPLSVKMSCAGCGWAFEPSTQRPRTEWARESFRIDGPGIMSLEPQVAVKCRATLLCATPLNLCLADISRTRRGSFVACRCSRAAVYPIAWEKLRPQIDAVGLRRRIRLRGLLVRELRELRRIEVAGAMPADVVGTMLRSALALDLY